MISRRDSSTITDHAEEKVLTAHDLTAGDLLATGTEAKVYALNDEHVLKIYADPGQRTALETLADFYDRLDPDSVPYALPRIHHIEDHGSLLAVTERRLPGTPMSTACDLTSPEIERTYLQAVRDLAALRLRVPLSRRMLLTTQPETDDAAESDWNAFLRHLLNRRAPEVLPHLALDVPDIHHRIAAVLDRLMPPYTGTTGIIHGDLYPDNLLVAGSRVSAVIDFGTFTMIGDPLYDMAGACAYYRMYDEDRNGIRRRLLDLAGTPLSAPRRQQLIDYLHVIAVVSCDLYPQPQIHIRETGHYRWAVDVLNSPTDGTA